MLSLKIIPIFSPSKDAAPGHLRKNQLSESIDSSNDYSVEFFESNSQAESDGLDVAKTNVVDLGQLFRKKNLKEHGKKVIGGKLVCDENGCHEVVESEDESEASSL